MRELIYVPLRAWRAAVAGIAAAGVERYSSLEPLFVRAGRSLARRSRLGGGLYGCAQEALIQRLGRSGHRYREVTIRNFPLQVDVTDPTGRSAFFYSVPYEKEVTDAVITALKPGDVFLDVGANIGYFSALGAKLVGASGRVVAFEPHEKARDGLRAMAARNEVDQIIEVVPFAVAERVGDVALYTADEATSYSTLNPELAPMREVVAYRPATVVHTTSLDAWLAGRPDLASRVRCIKIDVEGAESRVLTGMTRTLLSHSVTILCETTVGSDADAILERAGFQRHRIERGTLAYGNFLYVRSSRSPLSLGLDQD